VRKFVLALLIISALLAASASAQFLGQMSPASILDVNTGKAGGYFVTAEDAFAVVGSFRYGFGSYTEGRFRLGFIDQDGPQTDPHFIFGVDGKYILWRYGATGGSEASGETYYENPIDLSLGFFAEYAVLESSRILGLGGGIIASRPFPLTGRSIIEPYARLNIRYEGSDLRYERHTPGDFKEGDDFEVGLNAGALFSVTPLVDFTAEIQIDEQMAFMLGIDVAAF